MMEQSDLPMNQEALEPHSEAGEHFGLAIIRKMADETVVQHFRDERGRAFWQASCGWGISAAGPELAELLIR